MTAGTGGSGGGERRAGGGGSEGGERMVPFYCPYCGEEDLRPATAAPGSWQCGTCARAFELRFAGLVPAAGLRS